MDKISGSLQKPMLGINGYIINMPLSRDGDNLSLLPFKLQNTVFYFVSFHIIHFDHNFFGVFFKKSTQRVVCHPRGTAIPGQPVEEAMQALSALS